MIRSLRDSERLLEIDNAHAESCGAAPDFDAAQHYLSYFENSHGEQWVFCGDRSTQGDGPHVAWLWGGDINWTNRQELSWEDPAPDLSLNEAERHWLIACWIAFASSKGGEAVIDQWNQCIRRRIAQIKRQLRSDNDGND